MVHLRKIDLNLFQVFDAIYSEGSITRASQRLNLSQPAVSHALTRLRDSFGDPLFERRGRVMAPTVVAQNAAGPVREALRKLEVALAGGDRFDPVLAERQFVVGLRNHQEPMVLPKLMQKLAASHSGIRFAFVRSERRTLERDLVSGAIDMAIDVLLPLGEQIKRRCIATEPLVVLARRGHKGVGGNLSMKTYLSSEHIQVSARRGGLSVEDFELSRHGLQRRVRLRCQNYFAAAAVVGGTDLLLTLPAHYARTMDCFGDNRTYPFPGPRPKVESYLYWHSVTDNDAATAWLRSEIANAFQ